MFIDQATLADAYVYLLGRMLVLRQERTDLAAPGADYNVVMYNALGSADFVNPNLDVAYLEAWLAVDDETPVILTVPRVTDRYYTAQILDEWGEVVVNINDRTLPSAPYGQFALMQPGSRAVAPVGATRIDLHSAKAKMLARVELKDDAAGAVELQHRFTVDTANPVSASPIPPIPDFGNADLIGAEIFTHADEVLASALDVSPLAAQLQQTVRAVAAAIASDPAERERIDTLLREQVIPGFQTFVITESAPYRNHWVGGGRTGNYGGDFWLRSAINYAGIWANTSDEVIYFLASRDAHDNPLLGSNAYTLTFPADALPDAVVDSYWSIILVGVPDYRVVPNPRNRFNFNTYSPLQKSADGSLTIAISAAPIPGVPESNWLPAPDGRPFSLTFRAYVPRAAVKNGSWVPPAVNPEECR